MVPVDLTLPLSPDGDDRGDDFLTFLVLRVVAVVVVPRGVTAEDEGDGAEVEDGVWATTSTPTDDETGDESPAFKFESDMETAGRLLQLVLLLRLSSATEALLLLLGIEW